jgi:phage terminase large subunit
MKALEDQLEEYWDHPAKMVREIFGAEPDPWQEEALELFPTTPRIAMKACKGPGKSTVLAWLGWNYLLTRPHPKIAATSISATNLADGLWSEMAKWQAKSELLKAKFTWTKTRIFSNEHPETWFMAFKSWSRSADANEQANTLAGFHADYVLFLLDETGGMPRSIMPTAEAAFAGCIECHIVQAGNPTNLEGPLHDACTRGRHLWKVMEITGDPDDPKRSGRIPIEHAKQQIAQYGRDNPWVQVNIFGRFPPAGLNQLIGPDEIAEAMRRHYSEFEIGRAPKIIGVDVARFGDDSSVIFLRQGLQSYPMIKHRNIDSIQGAGNVAHNWGIGERMRCSSTTPAVSALAGSIS